MNIPAIPTGRQSGQRFFRVAGKDFHYLSDEPLEGYSHDRRNVWVRAMQYAIENRVSTIEELTTERLNMYVGSGVYSDPIVVGITEVA